MALPRWPHDHAETVLAAQIQTLGTLLETLRALEINRFTTFYDAVLGRLLTGAGQVETARARLDTALQFAHNTQMHFYDAELLRLRACTHDDAAARQADVDAALEVSRGQGATLFELRAALDNYALRGEPARIDLLRVVEHMPVNSALRELTAARAVLISCR